MNDRNKKIKPFCRYCDKELNEDKGEIAHGCLDCHRMPWQERIDAMEKKIQSLKQQLADANAVIGFYGNEFSWHRSNESENIDDKITLSDVKGYRYTGLDLIGGSKARAYQEKWGLK